MSTSKSTSHHPVDSLIVDLTDSESPDVTIFSPFTYPPTAFRPVTHTTSTARANRKAARRSHQRQDVVVDLIDDSDSDSDVKMVPGFCMPSGRKASKIYKVDPNESALLRDEMNLDPRILNAHVTDTADVVAVRTIPPPNPEALVLDVFPDADLLAVKIMLNERGNNPSAVIEYMSEHKYPKAEGSTTATTSLRLAVNEGKEWMYDYTSAESFIPTNDYIAQATDLLLCDFPFLSKMGATSFMSTCRYHYALSHKMVLDIVKGAGDETVQYNRVLDSVKKKPLKEDQKDRISSLLKYCRSPTVKTPIRRKKVLITDKVLQDERQYVTSKMQEWMDAQKAREDREWDKKISQLNGTAVECSCCFDSFPFHDMVSCSTAGHLFCLDCIKSFTENLIFGNGNLGVDRESKKLSIELQCFHGDGCSSGFSRSFLQKALPTKSMEKYDEIQCEISIKLAGLTDMCSCPKCGFQADVPSGQKVFECPAAKCLYASCRECGEAAHIPLRYVGFIFCFLGIGKTNVVSC
jgi:TRIAD3 protein (E3 ubiquitin-protein ligase RNF216)